MPTLRINRQATSSLDAVIITDELSTRPLRRPDYEIENRAMVALAEELSNSPETILQRLAAVTLDLCQAGSAGISLLVQEPVGLFFRWPAIAGAWRHQVGGGTPRNFGPCGVVLDTNAPQLFSHPARYYSYLEPVTPPLIEVLLIPFYVNHQAVGTIWVVSHDEARKFDSEDLRRMSSLTKFACAAYQILLEAGSMKTPPCAVEDQASILTGREREVLHFLADGKAIKEIARTLDLSNKTIESHRRNLMDKLRLYSIAELTKYAIREGVTSA
jgi:DNA-binding CsgD family transcriptional regulator